jgi:ABC-type multidrug transport system fused ATPase/permease subunit
MAISKAISASGAFFGVIDSKRDDPPGIREPEVSSHADIVFQNVTFSYPTRPEMTVLKGFNARFERNKTTALVGPSGSGKSTIVAMIERWYQLQSKEDEEATSGQIRVGDHNINDMDVKWWRSQIGLVQQEPFLFNDSIYNNVAFGLIGSQWENDTEPVKMELITAACKQAFADEFVDRLPMVLLHPRYLFFILVYLIISFLGLLDHCRGRWDHIEWRTAPKNCHRAEYRQPTPNSHS